MPYYVPIFPASSVQLIVACKERGNEAYSKAKYPQAIQEYTKGLSYFTTTASPSLSASSEDVKDSSDPVHLLTSLLSNRSASYLESGKMEEAFADADEVVRLRPHWVKGYFRKGEALAALKRYPEALDVYQEARKRDKSSKPIVQRLVKMNMLIDNMNRGLVIHQLLSGREICQKSVFSPINSLIYDFAHQLRNFIYVVADIKSKDCVLVDPCWDIDGILKFVKNEGLNVVAAIATHQHVDHVGGLPPSPYDKYGVTVEGLKLLLKRLPKIVAYVNANDIPAICKINPDIPVDRLKPTEHLQVISLPLGAANATTTLQFYHTPGHTPGSQCVLVDGCRLLSGDTLFIGSCGRVDFPESNPADMYTSLNQILGSLPDDVIVLPGHDYGGEFTTILQEKKHGLLRPCSKEDFLTAMNK
ncbi:hypothetical protein SmJEL517_g04565 [Synchytrium microbalum]|uniref:Metallo-beta-lactamase domain-containing protein n=1 Tax=Synchytrium microbalum TaxID=1806994 RepID=A0A507BRD5_9FUNG|nr:uncharacterized protein SmJEL517_g04565 [Synchytrium microbalum]TPX32260.1 hypothetical protein SmJEL517_g04565 [Synchytrium microbalum]